MEENMTSMKRNGFLCVLVLAMVVLFVLPLLPMGTMQASAAENDATDLPVVRIENKTVHRGQTFEIQIYLDQNIIGKIYFGPMYHCGLNSHYQSCPLLKSLVCLQSLRR